MALSLDYTRRGEIALRSIAPGPAAPAQPPATK
jgi:hypothetical protein